MQSFKNLYRQNQSCYYAVHLFVTIFFVPLGFNFVTRVYNGKCFNPFLSIAVLLFWIVFLQLGLEGFFVFRDFMIALFAFYYIMHFLYMCCFVQESFEAQSKKCKDPVERKIQEVTEKRKSRLVFQV